MDRSSNVSHLLISFVCRNGTLSIGMGNLVLIAAGIYRAFSLTEGGTPLLSVRQLQKLVFNEAKEDLDKICNGPNKIPAKFVLIVGGKVSANMRTRIAAHAKKKGIHSTEVWSGFEFEERN